MGQSDSEAHFTKLYNVSTDEKISSGDEIHLCTDGPERLPLPNLDLLEMQWALQCVAAMSVNIAALFGGLDFQYEPGDDDDNYPGSDEEFMASSVLLKSQSTLPSSPFEEAILSLIRIRMFKHASFLDFEDRRREQRKARAAFL
jgi:hypothetical protein